MSMDPGEFGQGPPPVPGDTGTPAPAGADPRDAEIDRLKQENAKLREERRADRAKALGAEHGLTPTQVELLQLVPADQMEEKAAALQAERGGPPAPAAPAGGDAPTGEPPVPVAEPVVDPTLASFEPVPGGDAPDPARSHQDELRERLNGAKSLEEIEQIQHEMREKQRANRRTLA